MHWKSAYFWEHRFWVDFGRVLDWFLEWKILDFHILWNVFSIKIDIKLKLRETSEKSKEPEARPSLPGGRPLWTKLLRDEGLATFYWKTSAPPRREANFGVLAQTPGLRASLYNIFQHAYGLKAGGFLWPPRSQQGPRPLNLCRLAPAEAAATTKNS